MKFEIKNCFSGELIFSIETDTWKLAVEAAIKAKADLSSADLRSANLRSADLRSANLSYANLRSADLRSADLSSAKMDDNCFIETGETWGEYKTQTVPALLCATGKELKAVIEASWDCHSWENCPMAIAFNVHEISEVPILYRPRANQFIKYFDAGMLKKEEILKGAK